jgi:hypothetical protein
MTVSVAPSFILFIPLSLTVGKCLGQTAAQVLLVTQIAGNMLVEAVTVNVLTSPESHVQRRRSWYRRRPL